MQLSTKNAIAIVAVAASRLASAAPTLGTTVNLDYGTFKGALGLGGTTSWRGMPYAAAPTGNLRWRAPQDPPRTSGVQSASSFKDVCIGNSQSPGYNLLFDAFFSEDCLYISVQSPTSASNSSKLPVVFYISGGGYSTLSNPNYDFSDFIAASGGNIVAVQANYRLGALGFLSGSDVKAGGALNAGLLDQRKALQWTQKYISAFGGDPNHVVILGGSAGAGSVSLQMAAYGGRDDKLFAGGVEDAAFSPQVNNATYSEFQYQNFASGAGCGQAADKLACLRGLSIADIQKANVVGTYPGKPQQARFTWTPVVDGTFLIDYPLALYKQGKFVKVPLITGDVNDEGTLFAYNAATPEDVSDFISSNYPLLDKPTLAKINALYPLRAPFPLHNAYFPSAAAAYGEATFTCPSTLIAQQMSSAGPSSQVYNYRFNQPSTLSSALGLGVAHNIDLGAIFGARVSPVKGIGSFLLDLAIFSSYRPGAENAAVRAIMMPYIVSFVRYLDPNQAKNENAPQWAPMVSSGTQQRLLLQNVGTGMEAIPASFLSRCQFWEDLIPVTGS